MKNHKHILFLFAAAIIVLGILISLFSKGELELKINQNHNSTLGFLFSMATHLGDGWMYAIVILIFLCLNYLNAFMLASIAILQTIIVQVLKKIVFADMVRPKAFFINQPDVVLNFTEGVEVHTAHSFPSGHTATAFALAFFLAYQFNKKVTTLIFLFLAVIAGFSRVYLMQHFFMDVFAGATIGTLSSCLIILIFNTYLSKIKDHPKWQKGLLKR